MLKKLVSVALASLLLAAFGSSAAPIVNGSDPFPESWTVQK